MTLRRRQPSRAARWTSAAALLGCAACTLVEPLSDYEGPSKGSGGIGVAVDSGSGGNGAVTAGAGGFPIPDCKDDGDCSDGDLCNGVEKCNATGECEAGVPPKLSDNNSCTVDYCDPKKGVVHEGGAGPAVKACGSTSTGCPKGYFYAKALICDTECGGPNNCGFCINGMLCEQACLATHQVCCVNKACKDVCPTGYGFVKEVSSAACGCGSGLPAAVCQRK